MSTLQNGSKRESNPDSLDCQSDILELSHRAPRMHQIKIERGVKTRTRNTRVHFRGPLS